MGKKQLLGGENNSIQLICGRDVVRLGIRDYEGWNITAFLDHLEFCEECSQQRGTLITALNKMIGSNAHRNRYFD